MGRQEEGLGVDEKAEGGCGGWCGISFLIIYFKKLEEIYIIFSDKLFELINNNNERNLSLSNLRKFGYMIKLGISPYIDYLEVIDEVYKKNFKF